MLIFFVNEACDTNTLSILMYFHGYIRPFNFSECQLMWVWLLFDKMGGAVCPINHWLGATGDLTRLHNQKKSKSGNLSNDHSLFPSFLHPIQMRMMDKGCLV